MKTIIENLETRVKSNLAEIKSYTSIVSDIEKTRSEEFEKLILEVIPEATLRHDRVYLNRISNVSKPYLRFAIESSDKKFGHDVEVDFHTEWTKDDSATQTITFNGSGWFATSGKVIKDPSLLSYLKIVTELNKQALEKKGKLYDFITDQIKTYNSLKRGDTWKLDKLRKALVFVKSVDSIGLTLEELNGNKNAYHFSSQLDYLQGQFINNLTDDLKALYGNSMYHLVSYKNRNNDIAPKATNVNIQKALSEVNEVLNDTNITVFA